MIIAMGFFIFAMAVKYLPIFEDEHHAASLNVHATELAEIPETDRQQTLVH
jgi:hypothetical protein